MHSTAPSTAHDAHRLPLPPQLVFASAAERDAWLPAFKLQAEQEAAVEEVLQWVKLNSSATKDHVLDSLWRWEAMGGAEYVAALPVAIPCANVPAGARRSWLLVVCA